MAKNPLHFTAVASLLLLASGISRALLAEEPAERPEPYRVWVDDEPENEDDPLQFAVETEFNSDYYLVQEGAATPPTTAPSLSRSEAVAARQRRSTYRLPSMFGDYFGGGIAQVGVLGSPMVFQQTITDGQNGSFFVTNDNGGFGADPNLSVPIHISTRSSGPSTMFSQSTYSSSSSSEIAWSIGPGVPREGTVEYPISDPTTSGFSPPQTHGQGVLVYDGGTAEGQVGNGDFWTLNFQHTFTPIESTVLVPSGGVAVRRFKVSENNSPIPRDRFIANYNYFNNVIGGIGSVNRYTFGFEKTFFDGNSSIEVRFPFASTLAADQIANGVIAKGTQFGDIPILFKTIIAQREEYVLAGGFGVTLPSGSDGRVFDTMGNEIVHINHTSVHLLPYLGLVRAYDTGWYWQSFLQLDIDANGNRVAADLSGANPQPVGVLQEQTLFFADLGVGYRFTDLGDDGSPAVAATAELHYATPLQETDAITAGTLDIRNLVNRFDVVNLTLGLNILTNRNISIRPAFVVPLNDQQFNYEAMVQANIWR